MLFAFAAAVPVHAEGIEDEMGIGALTDALDSETEDLLKGVSPLDLPDESFLSRLLNEAAEKIISELRSVTGTAVLLLTVCVLVALSNTLDLSGREIRFILLAGVAAIGSAALSDLDSYLRLGSRTLRDTADYAKILLPVLSSAAAAAGSVGGAAARYAATSLFISVLLELADSVVMPCISAFAAVSIADAAVGNEVLKGTKKLLKKTGEMLLSALCLCFTAWITLTGVISDSADAVAARAAKTAISTMLPVVGSILSDAAGSLAAAAEALRGSVGVFGILVIVCMCIGPFAALGTRYLAYKLSAAICECASDKRLTKLVEDMGTCFGMILAVNGAGALMLFVSFYSLIRTSI